METKSTITRVKRSDWRPVKPKAEFTLYGTVLKKSEKTNSILVEKGGSTTTFWLSCNDCINDIEVNNKYKFTINISSFISKEGSNYITKLNVLRAIDTDTVEEGFEVGHIPVNIHSYHKTEVPGLYVLTTIRMSEGKEMEKYHLRFFTKDLSILKTGTAIIRFTINKTKDIIDHKGNMTLDIETRTFINSEGEEETVKSPLYKPCLSILEILY